MRSTNVVIIGAGPAGCAASIQLAKAGMEVYLIEMAEFPRDRPGESLHPGVGPIFETLGVSDEVEEAGFLRHAGHEIDWDLDGTNRFEKFGEDGDEPWLGYQAWRSELDGILLEKAKSLGVEVHQPCRAVKLVQNAGRVVGLMTERGHFAADFVLDASGRSSWLRKQLGVSWERFSGKMIARYGYVTMSGSEFSVPFMKRDDEGWTWLSRVCENRIAWVRLRFDGVDPGQDWSPPQLPDDGEGSRGADVSWRLAKAVAGPGWFLLGDAAAVMDPAASHGVLRALMSGMQAAHFIEAVAVRGYREDLAFENYEEWLRRWVLADVAKLRELYPEASPIRTK